MRLYVLIERLTLLRGVAMSILYTLMGVIKYSQTYDCSDLILLLGILKGFAIFKSDAEDCKLNNDIVKPIDIKHIECQTD